MKMFTLGAATCFVLLISTAVPRPADAQRRGHRPAGAGVGHINHSASIGAGRGQARQDLRVRRDARSSINYNRNIRRDVNINRNLNVDVDVHHEYGYGYRWRDDHYHPVARAAVATAAAVTTAAVIGSMYRTLPAGCVTIIRAGISYYQCGPVWYQPTYVGSSIQYVVVEAP